MESKQKSSDLKPISDQRTTSPPWISTFSLRDSADTTQRIGELRSPAIAAFLSLTHVRYSCGVSSRSVLGETSTYTAAATLYPEDWLFPTYSADAQT